MFTNLVLNFVQDVAEVSQGFKLVGAGLATAGLTGAGIGIGLIFSSLIIACAKNPLLKGQFFAYAILGFALVEAIALFALMVAFLILFGK